MKDQHGITVSLQTPDRLRIKEYDNDTDNEPHPDFKGCIATRQIAVEAGNVIEVKITFDEDLQLFSADGVCIEICSGSPTGPLPAAESIQRWWIQRTPQRSVAGTYIFSYYKLFDDAAPDPFINFRAPGCDDPSYANVSHKLSMGERLPLSPSSLVVSVRRGRWYSFAHGGRTKTEPPQTQGPWYRIPKSTIIIHHKWAEAIKSNNGLPYIFEFRNMGLEGVIPDREEAKEETEPVVNALGDTENAIAEAGNDEVEDNDEVSSDDLGISGDEYQPPGGRSSVANISNLNDAELAMYLSSPGNRGRTHRRKRPRVNYDESSIFDDEPASPRATRTTKLNDLNDGPDQNCNPDEQDDREDLPQSREPTHDSKAVLPPWPLEYQPTATMSFAENRVTGNLRTQLDDPSRLPTITTKRVHNAPTIPTPSPSASNTTTPTPTVRARGDVGQANRGITAMTNNPTATAKAQSFPTLTPRAFANIGGRESARRGKRTVVDLTNDDDEAGVEIKAEDDADDTTAQRPQPNMRNMDIDDDDEEDLEDELREIQIKRKLRKMKKRKLASGGIGA